MIPLNTLSLRHGPQNGCYGHFCISIDDDDVADEGVAMKVGPLAARVARAGSWASWSLQAPLFGVYPRRRRRCGRHPFPEHALRATERLQDERFFLGSMMTLLQRF